MPNLSIDTGIDRRPIQRGDWGWVQAWFRDPWLNKELGPMDKDWLNHVIAQTDGAQLVATIQDEPVGLIGFTWGDGFHTITDLAIDPAQRRGGLGRRVLKCAMRWSGHPKTKGWVTYTAKDNDAPAQLLKSSGWVENGEQSGMRRFECMM